MPKVGIFSMRLFCEECANLLSAQAVEDYGRKPDIWIYWGSPHSVLCRKDGSETYICQGPCKTTKVTVVDVGLERMPFYVQANASLTITRSAQKQEE